MKKVNTHKPKNINRVILSIETSCDETAAAVLKVSIKKPIPAIETLSSVVKSQVKLHSKMGGVVPEAAARAHVKTILPVVQKAIKDSGLRIKDINYIAVTAGPGLIPSLIVGVEFAKALSFSTGIPILPINHMAGHLYSPFGQIKDLGLKMKDLYPQISLIVSGGHTILVVMKDSKNYEVIGQTVDDAVGEAFDKVAKLLGLPYPGGPEVSKMADQAAAPVEFPRPMIHTKDYNFSFAGLKTAVLYYTREFTPQPSTLSPDIKTNICAGFQNAAIDVLVTKTMRAVKAYGAKSVSLSGGVSANKTLREQLMVKCHMSHVMCFIPPFHLCTDNAEMIGIAAAFALTNGQKPIAATKVKANPNLSLSM